MSYERNISEDENPNDEPVTAITCGSQCSDGDEHKWDVPVVRLENGGSSSCAKCGKLAIDVSMWELP